jgi:hypothetical protein
LPVENAFKILLDNYEALYTEQEESARKASEYENKIQNLLTTRTKKDGKEVEEVPQDWEQI